LFGIIYKAILLKIFKNIYFFIFKEKK